MDLAASSSLLYSRYSKCVPLIDPIKYSLRGPNEGERNGAGAVRRYDNEDENIAFLSSVQMPSELCLALACVSRRREAVRRSEQGPLLVFVPFHEPRDEVFVEVPVAAFGNAKRQRGLHLLPLNDYSSLCADAKDGLPPRRGFFVTFRTRAEQQRFRAAIHQLIRDCAYCGPLDGNVTPRCVTRHPKDTMQHRKKEVEFVRGGEKTDTLVAAKTSCGVVDVGKHASKPNGAIFFIDSLLAERDRRRAEYIAGIQGSPPGDRRHGDEIDSSTWSGQQQAVHPELWNMIDGAVERQATADRCVERQMDAVVPLSERDTLLRQLCAAVEAYDNMSDAQGSGEMNLMGAARQFLCQHQNHLWQLQHAGSATHLSAAVVGQEDAKTHPQVVGLAATAQPQLTVNGSSAEALRTPRVDVPDPRERRQSLQQTVPVPPPLTQDAAGGLAHKLPDPSPLQQSSLGPEDAEQDAQRCLQEELQRAREIESRILSSFHTVAPHSLAAKGVFGRAPKTSWLPSASLDVSVRQKGGGGGEANGGGGTAEFETVNVTLSPAQMEAQPVGVTNNAVTDAPKEAEAKSPHCGAGWRPVRDSVSDKSYYVHDSTKKTTWKIEDTFKGEPQETGVKEVAACGAEWRAVIEPSSGRTYYVHRRTKATTWKLEDTLREDVKTSCANLTASQHPEKKKRTEWAERKDPATGKVYYYNKKTKQTTWKRAETDLDPL
ncbi:hypothetical protein TraAM80_07418 [Trypanosoma rangeli]|uniref:WW domain-containing protein n=1 Tax=Trypanosoma rangeli TaxID=5698 RepID=A0A3R7RE15_TRYRA|nr:uncharacterized protein TraAM80_07418 [Trypanosoma rangeli]RNF00764.1 hypothetical protein TraAM80_07418 [Trypanosoma rangeli]|eukprot:RNF00764.1 hypothetical protein TraAM80_07418 [Trypanosoma rangeli]